MASTSTSTAIRNNFHRDEKKSAEPVEVVEPVEVLSSASTTNAAPASIDELAESKKKKKRGFFK